MEQAATRTGTRVLALQKGIQPRASEVGIYYKGLVQTTRQNSMIHDASVTDIIQLLTGHLWNNLPLVAPIPYSHLPSIRVPSIKSVPSS